MALRECRRHGPRILSSRPSHEPSLLRLRSVAEQLDRVPQPENISCFYPSSFFWEQENNIGINGRRSGVLIGTESWLPLQGRKLLFIGHPPCAGNLFNHFKATLHPYFTDGETGRES